MELNCSSTVAAYSLPSKDRNSLGRLIEIELQTEVEEVHSVTTRHKEPDNRDNTYPKRRFFI